MKMKALFFALLLAVSSTALANENPAMAVVALQGSDVFKVIYKGTTTGKVRLNVLNAQGKTLYTETISSVDGFIVPVNFKGLAAGHYGIELVTNNGRFQENVTYQPVVDGKSIHVSKILTEEGKFLLAVANARNEEIHVRIYDNSERLLYSESKTLSGDFAQVFRIDNKGGKYTFEVSDAFGNKKYFNF